MKEGTLHTIINQLEEKGYKVDHCWNKWEYWCVEEDKEALEEEFGIEIEEGSPWTLTQCKKKEPHPELYTRPTLWLYGTPGTEPSIEQKERAIQELADRKEKQEEGHRAYMKAIEEQNKPLKEALKGLVGGVVLKFNEEDNFILIRTTEGRTIKVTSTHRVWNYGDDSDDSLEFYLIDTQS
jgi:uncharacterized FlaG/YvyC family protein